jgi:hypothetical protein|tara:strand:- start:13 stop:468 length:456 start_codon:yes stop_codon:yes gene_type:complete
MKKLSILSIIFFIIPSVYAIDFNYIKESLEQTFSLNISILVIALAIFIMTLINYLHTRTQLSKLREITEKFKVDYVHEKIDHLNNYVSFCRNLGYKDKWIIISLKKAGWQKEHINNAINKVNALTLKKQSKKEKPKIAKPTIKSIKKSKKN